MNPRSRYIAHSSSLTQERRRSRARCSARRSRPGSKRRAGARRRRARCRLQASSRRGMIRSDRSASATNAVAASASSTTGGGLPAARRPREEDHPVGVSWDLVERADHPGLALSARACCWHGGPQTLVELAPEFLDEPLLVGGHSRVALRDQHLAVTWPHPQKAHRPIMSKRPGCDGGWGWARRPSAVADNAEHVDRAGAGADARQPAGDGGAGHLLGAAGCLERRIAERPPRRE